MTDSVFDALRRAWTEARNGAGRCLHVEGPTGMGRSLLLARLADFAGRTSDTIVVRAGCADELGVHTAERGLLEELVLRVSEGVRAFGTATESTGEVLARPPWLLPGSDFLAAANAICALPRFGTAPTGHEVSREQVYADLLLDVARDHPLLLCVDDAHRADPASRRLIDALARDPMLAQRRILVVLTAATRLVIDSPDGGSAAPQARLQGAPLKLTPCGDAELETLARAQLPTSVDDALVSLVIRTAGGNPRLVLSVIDVLARTGVLSSADASALGRAEPELAGLRALGQGRLPAIAASVLADLRAAAVIGARFDTRLLALLWEVPLEAARQRCLALVATGLVQPEGPPSDGAFVFVTPELGRQVADTLADDARRSLHVRIATLLRTSTPSQAAEDTRPISLDVTETWSEARRRERRAREDHDRLGHAARHFALARRPQAAAEAAVTLAERLMETAGGHPFLFGRWGKREDRERRLRIHTAIQEAASQLDVARAMHPEVSTDAELVTTSVRVLAMRARFRATTGAFREARQVAEAAAEMAGHLQSPPARLAALRVLLEVCYSAGDQNAGRASLVRLLAELTRAPKEEARRVYAWLAEALSRWEWVGLHDRIHPYLIEQLRALGDHRGVVRARLDRLANAPEDVQPSREALLDEAVSEARSLKQLAYAAERMATSAAELINALVDAHYDALSGEFFPPDLFGDHGGDGDTAAPQTILERLAWPVYLMERAEELARESEQRITRLRVLNVMLGVTYDTRERFGDLLDRWLPGSEDQRPLRLVELLELLNHGFFGLEHLESLTDRIVQLGQLLGLDQVVADTIYEALDRDVPAAVRRSVTFFELARTAYERVGDIYGLVTLLLVEHRHAVRGADGRAEDLLAVAHGLVQERGHELTPEQRAFIHSRLGELLLEVEQSPEDAVVEFERAIAHYDQVGDVEHVQSLGDILRDLYSRMGDLGRYRRLRDRFRALESPAPSIDPLGLELRIEHLLSLARQELNDERAIGMVERCVQLFGRMPDSTTRIDECYVEISKICRRRADEAQSEESYADWLRRSLEAVRRAVEINRALGNWHRVFEEMHELFDDLLGLGDLEAYLEAREESRDLAFSVGHVHELLYLFDEHLHYDADRGFDRERLPEVRGFFEALTRYLLGLGATSFAVAVKRSFLAFCAAIGDAELAGHYASWPPHVDP
jgi:hypothetical protein